MLRRIAIGLTVLGFMVVFAGISQAGELTVSGGDIYFQISANSVESRDLTVDSNGYLLPDGVYTYEFRIAPEVDAQALEEIEEAGDQQQLKEIARAEAEQMYLEAGSFEIVDGVLVPPEDKEYVDTQPEDEVDVQDEDPILREEG